MTPHDPEVRANLGVLGTAIAEIHRIVVDRPSPTLQQSEYAGRQVMRTHTTDLIRSELLTGEGRLQTLGVAAVRQLVRDLDEMLIEYGDDTHLFTLVKEECLRSGSETAPAITWVDAFPDEPLTDLQAFFDGRTVSPEQNRAMRRHLLALHKAQWDVYNQKRARAELKSKFLAQLTAVMTLILLGFAAAIGFSGSGNIWVNVALAASAGAVGASLSAAFKMRDTVRSSLQARSVGPIALMQPIVGAIAGLVMLLVLESGLVQIKASVEWAAWGAMAFLAGFSEPFFLNVVGRIAKTEVSGGADAPPAPRAN